MKRIITLCVFLMLCYAAKAQNEPNDCVDAITVCGNGTFASNADGLGDIQEVSGCGGQEHNSIWLKINIAQSGTLGFNLIPDNPDINVDYDFWVFGPNKVCSNLGNPIRCCTTNPFEAGLTDNHTGMDGSTVITQSGPGADGDGYVRWLNVTAGQFYYIVIDRPIGDGGFSIEWIGSATAGTGAFPQPPTANELDEVRTCSNNPNVGLFDLQALKGEINPDLVNNTITFYTSYANAVDGTAPLGNIISNTTNPQQIFVKVVDNTTLCSTITDITLRVFPIPTVSVATSSPTLCPGQNATITFTGTPNAVFHYTLNGGPNQTATLNNAGTFVLTQGFLVNTTIALVDANIISGTTVVCSQLLNGTATVNIHEMDELLFTANSVCQGENGVIALTGPANGIVSYSVEGGATQTVVLNAAGANTIVLPALTADTDFTIISITDGAAPFCTLQLNTNGTIIVHEQPVINTPAPMVECTQAPSGLAEFDLDSNNGFITGGNPEYVVTYYLTQAAANAGTPALGSPYQSTSANQTIYVRVEYVNNATCASFTTLNLISVQAPVVNNPAPLVNCEQGTNGNASFDLTQVIPEVTGGNPNLSVTFYTSQGNANTGTNPIAQPTTFLGTNGQIVYIRVVDNASLVCFATTTVTLMVSPSPIIPAITYELCEDPTDPTTTDPMADGIEEFDLTIYEPVITGGNPDLVVSYYTSNADALLSANPITNPGIYPNAVPNLDTVWVRVDNTVTNCYNTASFNLIVNPYPNADTSATFFACEEIPGQGDFNLADPANTVKVTGGASNVSVAYYANDTDALAGGLPTLPVIYIAPDMTQIWARVVDTNTGCFRVSPVTLDMLPAPIAPVLTPLEECDFDNNSVATFDLTGTLNGISTALGNVIVTAHETYDDADFHQNGTQGANPITNLSAYTNILDLTINGTQTLYILVQSANTECYDIAELQLIIHHVPEATTPQPYELCDNGLSDTDGIAIFDLTSVTPQVLGTINPATHTVTYHLNMNDATLNQNAIGNPAGYASTNATLYVRVTEAATGCYDIVQLELIVNPLPVANNPEPYTLCDVNNPGDEREVFDLTSRTEEIIILADGTLQDGINLTFHHTLGDAQGGTNAIATPESYINQTTVEAIYVRVTVEATGCYRVVLLDIRVEPLPLLVAPSDDELTVCDPDADGFAQFDLEALVADMVNNAPNLVVRFYESAIDAANSQNAIPNPDDYTNIVPFAQTIYVRVENTVTHCFTTTAYALDLVVVPSPQLPALSDLTLCDTDNNNQNAITAFNLTSQNAIILAGLGGTAADYTITYYTSLANAQNGAPRITNTTAYMGQDGQQIWIRVVDNTNPAGCFSIGTFFLRVNTPLALAPSHLWTKCNSELPNDTTEVFDLTLMDDTILGPFGVGLGYTVNYYTQDPRVNPAATPITPATAYTNPTNPVTLFVEVVTTGEGDCKSYTTLTLRVLPLPTPNFTPDALAMCDNNNSPDGVEVFDLTLAAADIINNEPNLVLSYHTTLEDANNDVNAIATPTAYESGTATIYVRVEANTNNPANAVCYQVVELELIVNPLPALGENGVIPAFAQCEPNTDGRGTFILSEHIPVILGANANPDDYTVRFYFDQGALAAGTALPNQYNNIASPQEIVVWVRHDATGCIATGTMDLLVEEAALANTPDPAFLETCDDDGNNDGVHTFDLTLFNSDILGTQSPTDYSVSYYESQEDAEAGTNAIADPANYTNGFSPYLATIYARVTNEATISGCYATTSVELIVEALPEPNITSEGGQTICVDFKTGVVINPLTLYSNVEGAGYTYQWYFNGTLIPGTDPSSSSYDATVEGAYSVVVTGPSALSCVSDMSTAFTVIKSGPASPIGDGFTVSGAFSENQTIEVFVEGYGVYQYQLDMDGPWQTSNVFTNVSPGEHIIYVKDVKATEACDMIEIHSVNIIDYPNYFTPNGDGYHDTWNIIGLRDQEEAKIYIFDRYGKLIKQIAANGEGWDGTYNGSQLPADDYWFTVTYREPVVGGGEVVKEFKSHFALKR